MANAGSALHPQHTKFTGLGLVCMENQQVQAEGVKATNSLSLSKALPMASAL